MGRARLTITDLVYVVLGMAALAALYPPYRMVLSAASGSLDHGTMLLFQTVLPVALVVLLSVLYIEARGGGA